MTTSGPRADVRYPLATSSWDEQEIAAIHRVIASGRYSMGPEVRTFEKQFADFLGVPHAVMVNSGSSANLLMVAALFFRQDNPLRPGDEVIVPAVSWPTTYYPLQQYGLRLRFVDIDLDTLNYDLDSLREAINDRTRLLMVVNLLGNSNDFDQIHKLIADRDIVLIEDNCESLGATFGGQQTGTFGVAGTFSSFFSHHISTMEGGLICTPDEEMYHLLLSLRAHGWTRDLPEENRVSGRKSPDPFEESFKFVLPGYNVRPLEMEGAIGQVQLRKLPAMIKGRRRNAQHFVDVMSSQDAFIIQSETGESSWFGFSLVIRPEAGLNRRAVVTALRENGIECRPIVGGNFAKNPVLKWMDHEVVGDLPNASWIDENGLFVGNQEVDLRREIDHLAATLTKAGFKAAH